MNKKDIPKGWRFVRFEVDGEETRFIYEDEFGTEHIYLNYKEHIPTYKELEQKVDKYKEVLDKIKELLKSKQNGICYINEVEKQAYTFLLNFDEAREFIWKIEELLEEIK